MSTAARFSAHHSYRSVFLSDFHLGARGCRPGPILDVLRNVEADYLYLVGDILDTFHGARVVWGPEHDAVIVEIERLAATGTRVVYLPGNHDAPMRRPDAKSPFAGVEMREALIHTGADGRRHLVLHGDQCDSRVMRWHFMTRLGSRTDAALRRIDAAIQDRYGDPRHPRSVIDDIVDGISVLMTVGGRVETRIGRRADAALRRVGAQIRTRYGDPRDPRSVIDDILDGIRALMTVGGRVETRIGRRTDAALRRIDASIRSPVGDPRRDRSVIETIIDAANAAMTFGDRFEKRLAALAAAAGASGVVCGHSHQPALRTVDGITYANCGDWIDSRTALVEHHDGRFALLETAREPAPRPVPPIPVPLGPRLDPATMIAERQA